MREALEEVRKNIPKLFVNLVLLGNISEAKADKFPVEFLSNVRPCQFHCVYRTGTGTQDLVLGVPETILYSYRSQPPNHKRDYFDFTEPFVCPTNTIRLYS